MLFPFLTSYSITPNDRRMTRNIATLKAYFAKVIAAATKELATKGAEKQETDNLLGVLL